MRVALSIQGDQIVARRLLPSHVADGSEPQGALYRFQGPLIYSSQLGGSGRAKVTLNPALPEFPAGTEWVLVRRLCVIDDQGRIEPTRLVESIQLRRYLAVPAVRPAPESMSGFAPISSIDSLQFAEFDMQAMHSASLRAIAPGESDFTFFFGEAADPFGPFGQVTEGSRPNILHRCLMCHQSPGIFSVNGYHFGNAFFDVDLQLLRASDANRETQIAVNWKYRQFDWGLLQGLWRLAE